MASTLPHAVSEIDTYYAVEFLKAFDADGRHNIVAIPNTGGTIGHTFAPGDWSGIEKFIDRHNGKSNLYFSVNEPKPDAPHKKLSVADIAAARAVHVDLDPPAGADLAKDRIESIRKVGSVPAQPSFVVDSGGGVQAFWKLETRADIGDGEWLRALNVAACAALNGDNSVVDIARIMRLPHTLNIPDASKLKKHPGRQARMSALIDIAAASHTAQSLGQTFPPVYQARSERTDVPVVELDKPNNIASAIEYLDNPNRAKRAIEGAGGDTATFRVAAQLREFGLSESTALDLMLDHWNDDCSPPWSPDDLEKKVQNAFQYATGTWGGADTSVGLESIDDIPGGRSESASGATDAAGVTETAAEKGSHAVDPVDLWAKFEPPVLPRGLLPDVIERFARAQADIMGVDPGGLAASALAVCASAIPDRIELRVKEHDNWRESARVWVALVGNPSSKKSPIISQAAKPLRELDNTLVQAYVSQKQSFDNASKEDKKLLREPKKRRLILQDTTPEAAQEILRDSPAGVLCLQDEMSGWINAMGAYSGSRGSQKDRAFWLEAYNGGAFTADRISRGVVFIPHLSISLLGGVQPEVIRKIASDGADDGLLQRMFPIVLRQASVGKDVPLPPVLDEYRELVRNLHRLDPPALIYDEDLVGSEDVPLQFDKEGYAFRAEMEEYFNDLLAIEAVNGKLATHIGKFEGLFARLCVLFHCADNHELDRPPLVVPVSVARRVADFMKQFLLPHSIAFYAGTLGFAEGQSVLATVAGHLLAHPDKQVITFRDLDRGGSTLKALSREEGQKVLDRLAHLGWVEPVASAPNSNLPRWKVNPRAHELFAERAAVETEKRRVAREKIANLAKAA